MHQGFSGCPIKAAQSATSVTCHLHYSIEDTIVGSVVGFSVEGAR